MVGDVRSICASSASLGWPLELTWSHPNVAECGTKEVDAGNYASSVLRPPKATLGMELRAHRWSVPGAKGRHSMVFLPSVIVLVRLRTEER